MMLPPSAPPSRRTSAHDAAQAHAGVKARKRTCAERHYRALALRDRRRRHLVIIWNGVRISRKRLSPKKRREQHAEQMRQFWAALSRGIAVVTVPVDPPCAPASPAPPEASGA